MKEKKPKKPKITPNWLIKEISLNVRIRTFMIFSNKSIIAVLKLKCDCFFFSKLMHLSFLE